MFVLLVLRLCSWARRVLRSIVWRLVILLTLRSILLNLWRRSAGSGVLGRRLLRFLLFLLCGLRRWSIGGMLIEDGCCLLLASGVVVAAVLCLWWEVAGCLPCVIGCGVGAVAGCLRWSMRLGRFASVARLIGLLWVRLGTLRGRCGCLVMLLRVRWREEYELICGIEDFEFVCCSG